jgi:hypothetical protein
MKMAPMILQNSKLCKEDISQTIAILMSNARVLYGLNTDNLPVELWQVSFNAICERFNGIKVHDIQNAFKYSVIEKKAYTTLTRDELLQPISEYWSKRMILLSELEYFDKISNEEKEEINKDKEFKANAKQKYKNCLESGTWSGDEFEADAIARNFKDCFDQPFKDEIMQRAKNENFQRQKAAEGNAFILIPSWRKIFSRIYIEECLKRRILFVED